MIKMKSASSVICLLLCFLVSTSHSASVHDSFEIVPGHDPAHVVSIVNNTATNVEASQVFGPMESPEFIYAFNISYNVSAFVYSNEFTHRVILSTCAAETLFNSYLTLIQAHEDDTTRFVNLSIANIYGSSDSDYNCHTDPINTKAAKVVFDSTDGSLDSVVFVVVEGYSDNVGQFLLSVTSCGTNCLQFDETGSCACTMCAEGFALQHDGTCAVADCLDNAISAPACACTENYTDATSWSYEEQKWVGFCQADCSDVLSEDCESQYHRSPCSGVAHTCGPCLEGFVSANGVFEDANDECLPCFDAACLSCTNDAEGFCTECVPGYELANGGCTDVCNDPAAIWVDDTTLGLGIEYDMYCIEMGPSGNRAFVGAGMNTGSGVLGTVFVMQAMTDRYDWQMTQNITNPVVTGISQYDDGFGFSLDCTSNMVVIGAPQSTDVYDNIQAGSAFVFEESGDTSEWNFVAILRASNLVAGDNFGHSVAISNDSSVWVSVTSRDSNKGVVYAYDRNIETGEYTEVAILYPTTRVASERFGFSVSLSNSIDGNVMGIVGTHYSSACRAILFSRAYNETWKVNDVEVLNTNHGRYCLGAEISPSGEVAAVVSTDKEKKNLPLEGFKWVHIYSTSSGNWEHKGNLVDPYTTDERWGGLDTIQYLTVLPTAESAENYFTHPEILTGACGDSTTPGGLSDLVMQTLSNANPIYGCQSSSSDSSCRDFHKKTSNCYFTSSTHFVRLVFGSTVRIWRVAGRRYVYDREQGFAIRGCPYSVSLYCYTSTDGVEYSSPYPDYGALDIYKWSDTENDWILVENSTVPLTSQDYNEWAVFTNWLPPGEYEFRYAGAVRLDAEWLVENQGDVTYNWMTPTSPSSTLLNHVGVLDVTDKAVVVGTARHSPSSVIDGDQSASLFQLVGGTWEWTKFLSGTETSGISPEPGSVAFAGISDDGLNVVVGWPTLVASNDTHANIQVIQSDCKPPIFTKWPTNANETYFITPDGDQAIDSIVLAIDDLDPSPEITCDPSLSALLPVDVTTLVTCTATDSALNQATVSFNITLVKADIIHVFCPESTLNPLSAFNLLSTSSEWMTGINIMTPYTFSEFFTINGSISEGYPVVLVDVRVRDEYGHEDTCSFRVQTQGCVWSQDETALVCAPDFIPNSLRVAGDDDGAAVLLGQTVNGELISFDGIHLYSNDENLLEVMFGAFDTQQTTTCTIVVESTSTSTITCFVPRLLLEWTQLGDLRFQVSVTTVSTGFTLTSALSSDAYYYPVPPAITSVTGCIGAPSGEATGCSTYGGDIITISGSNIDLVTAVTVDGLACTNVTGHNDNNVTCVLPANNGRTLDVVAFQNSIPSSPAALVSYSAPIVLQVKGCDTQVNASTTNCPMTSNASIVLTITGDHFGFSDAAVFVGSKAAGTIHDDTLPSSTLYATLPDGVGVDMPLIVLQSSGVFTLTSVDVSVSYEDCPAGTFLSKDSCEACSAGTYTSTTSRKEYCLLCTTGRYQHDTRAADCIDCEGGKYASGYGSNTCTMCEAGKFSEAGADACRPCSSVSSKLFAPNSSMEACVDCPDNAIATDNGTWCICSEGYYDQDMSDDVVDCALCPVEYICTPAGRDVTTIELLPGYWRDDPYDIAATACISTEFCPGGVFDMDAVELGDDTSLCDYPREGPLCALCAPGFVAASINAPCEQCLDSGLQVLFFILAGLASAGFCGYYVHKTLKKADKQKGELSTLVKIMLSAFQINSIAISFSFVWEGAFNDYMAAQSAASSMGTSALNLSCLTASNDEDGLKAIYIETLLYLLSGLIVVVVPLMFLVPYLRYTSPMVSPWPYIKQDLIDIFRVALPIIFFLLYPTLTQRTMNLFHCTYINGTPYLTQQLDEKCWESNHLAWVFSVGVLMITFYALGLPLAGVFFLYKNRDKILSDHPEHATFHKHYSFLYKGYAVETIGKDHYAWAWEAVVTARKVFLMFILVFFANNAHVQSLLGLLAMIIALSTHAYAMPFESSLLNTAEFISLLCSFITFYLGQFTYVENTEKATRVAVSWMALIVNALFSLIMIGLMIVAVKEKHDAKKAVKRLRAQSELASDAFSESDAKNVGDEIVDRRRQASAEFRHYRANSHQQFRVRGFTTELKDIEMTTINEEKGIVVDDIAMISVDELNQDNDEQNFEPGLASSALPDPVVTTSALPQDEAAETGSMEQP